MNQKYLASFFSTHRPIDSFWCCFAEGGNEERKGRQKRTGEGKESGGEGEMGREGKRKKGIAVEILCHLCPIL